MPKPSYSLALALVLISLTHLAAEDLPVSPAQEYLQSGRFAEGETALTIQLDAQPTDDEARFGLGVIQFMRSIEAFGQAMVEYGVDSRRLAPPFLNMPIPKNDQPATVSYPEVRRVLEVLVANVTRAEATLAKISNPDVKLKLQLAPITFDFTKTGAERVTVSEILKGANGSRPLFQDSNAEIRIHFDRGDVAWLRAYCHLMAAAVEATLSVDLNPGFNSWFGQAFPKRESVLSLADKAEPIDGAIIDDAPRLRRCRLHLVAVCELNRETWQHIRQEKDDDFEWLSHPKQKDQLGLPISDRQIDAWLGAMQQSERMLKGESVIPGKYVRLVDSRCPEDHGLNVKKLFDDPPKDFLNYRRILEKGIDPKYLEPEAGKAQFDLQAFVLILQMYDGPFGFARAARMN